MSYPSVTSNKHGYRTSNGGIRTGLVQPVKPVFWLDGSYRQASDQDGIGWPCKTRRETVPAMSAEHSAVIRCQIRPVFRWSTLVARAHQTRQVEACSRSQQSPSQYQAPLITECLVMEGGRQLIRLRGGRMWASCMRTHMCLAMRSQRWTCHPGTGYTKEATCTVISAGSAAQHGMIQGVRHDREWASEGMMCLLLRLRRIIRPSCYADPNVHVNMKPRYR